MNGTARPPAKVLAAQLRVVGYNVEMSAEQLENLDNAAALLDAVAAECDAERLDTKAVLFGYAKEMQLDPDEVGGFVRVFFENHYVSGGPGYVGRVAIILFDGGDDPAVTMCWNKDAGLWRRWA